MSKEFMSKELMCSGWIDYAVGFVVGCLFTLLQGARVIIFLLPIAYAIFFLMMYFIGG